MSLFDATPYGGPPREPTVRKHTPPPDSVEATGAKWNGFSKQTPGLAHYVIGPQRVKTPKGDIAAIVAACGLVVVPHTYADDEVRAGCAKCDRQRP